MITNKLRRATKSRETLLSPLTEAAGEEAKWLMCLQNLIAIMCWISGGASRSSWRCHDCLLSTQHSDRWSWSPHHYWQKRVASLCFGVVKQIHFQQGFKMAGWCAPSQSRYTSLLLPCCRSKQLGLSWFSQPPMILLPTAVIESCAEWWNFSSAWRYPENCSGWPAANSHLQYFCSALPQRSPPKREECPGTADELPDTVYNLKHFCLFRGISEHLI